MGTLNHFTFYVLRLCFVYDDHLGNAQLAIGDLCALLPADHLLLDDPRVAKMARVQEPDQGVVVLIIIIIIIIIVIIFSFLRDFPEFITESNMRGVKSLW